MEDSEIDAGVFERSPDIVARSVEDEEILVPIVRSGDEVDSIYTLNEVGRFIWGRIDGERSVSSMVDAVKEEYEGDDGLIAGSVVEFFRDLLEIKAIRAVGRSSGAALRSSPLRSTSGDGGRDEGES